MFAVKRLQKELLKPHQSLIRSGALQLKESIPAGIVLVDADNFEKWLLDLRVLDQSNALYAGHVFRLQFKFSKSYPIEAPEVIFLADAQHPVPIHPHIYSNGIICLDLLAPQGWSPVHNVESICVSLQSMLTDNQRNERPPGDQDFVRTNRRNPREINFLFHDSNV